MDDRIKGLLKKAIDSEEDASATELAEIQVAWKAGQIKLDEMTGAHELSEGSAGLLGKLLDAPDTDTLATTIGAQPEPFHGLLEKMTGTKAVKPAPEDETEPDEEDGDPATGDEGTEDEVKPKKPRIPNMDGDEEDGGGDGGATVEHKRGERGNEGDHGGTSGRRKNESEEAYQARLLKEAAAAEAAKAANAVALEQAKAATIREQAAADAAAHHRNEEKAADDARERRRQAARKAHAKKPPPTVEEQARINAAVAEMRAKELEQIDAARNLRLREAAAKVANAPKPGMTWFGKTMIGFGIFMALFCGGFGLFIMKL